MNIPTNHHLGVLNNYGFENMVGCTSGVCPMTPQESTGIPYLLTQLHQPSLPE